MLTRGRTATLISVCSMLMVFGVVVFFDGSAEGRRKPGAAPKSSGVEKAQDPEPAEATPDAETFLRTIHEAGIRLEGQSREEILQDAANFFNRMQEVTPPPEVTGEAAGQDDGTSNVSENP